MQLRYFFYVYTLGLSFFFHDSAACLARDGVVVAAAREESFSRRLNERSFPQSAVEFCLKSAGIEAKDLDAVAFNEKPYLRMDEMLCGHFAAWPASWREFLETQEDWLLRKLRVKSYLKQYFGSAMPFLFFRHEACADAVQAAIQAYSKRAARPLPPPTPAWGPRFGMDEIKAYLERAKIPHRILTTDELQAKLTEALRGGQRVGWFQGALSFEKDGGSGRSILTSPEKSGSASRTPLAPLQGPVALTPQNAFQSFVERGLDSLVLENAWIDRRDLAYLNSRVPA